MEWLYSPEAWIALLTLTALEIVLGIDNIVFISILASKLPPHRQNAARVAGLAGAMLTRVALLLSLTWVMRLTSPLFTVLTSEISGRDIILILGGAFLLVKSTLEVHSSIEGGEHHHTARPVGFVGVVVQIMLLDIVFSFDSVVTAIGLARHVPVMVIAIVIAVLIMMVASRSIADFIERHPTMKVLALSFLLLIGVALVAEGLDLHLPKGYIYFAMAFSFFVEMVNLRVRKSGGGAGTPGERADSTHAIG
jgi:predicted tellurium resistance membrane protein TerC